MLTWALLPTWSRAWPTRPGAAPGSAGGVQTAFGLFTALTKLAGGASGAVLGLVLALAGLKDGALPAAGAGRVYLAACLIPLLGAGACLACIAGYAAVVRRPGARQASPESANAPTAELF
jgi:hypothetical protein